MALFLAQYTMVTIEAPTPTLGGSTSSISTSADLEAELGDLVIPQQETAKNASNSEDTKARAVTTNYATLLNEIDDFQFPSNITVSHMVQIAKYVQSHFLKLEKALLICVSSFRQAVPSISSTQLISIVKALHPTPVETSR